MSDHVGQIGLVSQSGFVPWLIRAVTGSGVNHVIIGLEINEVVSPDGDTGVAIVPADDFPDAIWSQFELTAGQKQKITSFALSQQGKPYSYADFIVVGIAALLKRWRLTVPNWVYKRLASTDQWICSSLADAALEHAGINLFPGMPYAACIPGSFVPIWEDAGWMTEQRSTWFWKPRNTYAN